MGVLSALNGPCSPCLLIVWCCLLLDVRIINIVYRAYATWRTSQPPHTTITTTNQCHSRLKTIHEELYSSSLSLPYPYCYKLLLSPSSTLPTTCPPTHCRTAILRRHSMLMCVYVSVRVCLHNYTYNAICLTKIQVSSRLILKQRFKELPTFLFCFVSPFLFFFFLPLSHVQISCSRCSRKVW